MDQKDNNQKPSGQVIPVNDDKEFFCQIKAKWKRYVIYLMISVPIVAAWMLNFDLKLISELFARLNVVIAIFILVPLIIFSLFVLLLCDLFIIPGMKMFREWDLQLKYCILVAVVSEKRNNSQLLSQKKKNDNEYQRWFRITGKGKTYFYSIPDGQDQ